MNELCMNNTKCLLFRRRCLPSVSVDVTVPSSAPSQTRLSDYFTRSDATDIVDRTPFLFPFILFDHMNGIKQESMRAS